MAHLTRDLVDLTYTVSQKNCANYFLQNFVKFPPTAKNAGTKMAKRISLCEVHSFSTSPNSCQKIGKIGEKSRGINRENRVKRRYSIVT